MALYDNYKIDDEKHIIICGNIAELFTKFYHSVVNTTGNLSINLMESTTIGGLKKSLDLVMSHNSSYDFYLSFSIKESYATNPIIKKIRFEDFNEAYDSSFNEETVFNILENVDQELLTSFAKDIFNTDIKISGKRDCKIENDKIDEYELKMPKNDVIPIDKYITGSESTVISLNNLPEWNFDSNNYISYKPHDF